MKLIVLTQGKQTKQKRTFTRESNSEPREAVIKALKDMHRLKRRIISIKQVEEL